MPTLDDAPILEQLTDTTVAETDLVNIFDMSTRSVKTISVADLAAAIEVINTP